MKKTKIIEEKISCDRVWNFNYNGLDKWLLGKGFKKEIVGFSKELNRNKVINEVNFNFSIKRDNYTVM